VFECDIKNAKTVDSLMRSIRPGRIYHLAAQSYPVISWKKPRLTLETNIIGTMNIFESVKNNGLQSQVLVACSSAEYGFVSKKEMPVKEDHPLRPLHPYGVSKVAQELLAYQYFENSGIRAVIARLFNTTGPGKVSDVCSDFARRIVAIEKGISESPMRVGNLDAMRDITDVRDMVRALRLALEKGRPGEVYNACTGKARKISHLLDMLLSLSDAEIETKVDPSLLRPSDEPTILGDNTKIREETGWKPRIPIEKTLEDTLSFWRQES
jgi:GDP-4-dehydro-6-deoxy-D-mannose reductase